MAEQQSTTPPNASGNRSAAVQIDRTLQHHAIERAFQHHAIERAFQYHAIERAFQYHAPKGDQPARYEAIRAKARELAHLINGEVPPSREKSLALTKLEEAVMWANAGIARNE